MTSQIPLVICIVVILWLFYRDRKARAMTSLSSWIPLLWIIIIGTRSVPSWFLDTSLQEITIDDYLEMWTTPLRLDRSD